MVILSLNIWLNLNPTEKGTVERQSEWCIWWLVIKSYSSSDFESKAMCLWCSVYYFWVVLKILLKNATKMNTGLLAAALQSPHTGACRESAFSATVPCDSHQQVQRPPWNFSIVARSDKEPTIELMVLEQFVSQPSTGTAFWVQLAQASDTSQWSHAADGGSLEGLSDISYSIFSPFILPY